MTALTMRLCRNNRERFSPPVEAWEAQGWQVECVDCLAQCGDCEIGPFVEADGEFVFADDLVELAERLGKAQAG